MTALLHPFRSIKGRLLGQGGNNELVSNEKRMTSPVVDASIAVAASQASPRAVTITLKDSEGNAVLEATGIELVLFLDAARVAFAATGGSTGIAASVGIVQAAVAKLRFLAVADAATGTLVLSWTDSAHEVAFLGVKLPNGEWVMSAALTTA